MAKPPTLAPTQPNQPRAYVAIEEQLKLIRLLTTKVNGNYPRTAAEKARELDSNELHTAMASDTRLREIIIGVLNMADPYYIDRPIARMLEESLPTIPDDAEILPEHLPSAAGFVWIDEPYGWALPELTPVAGFQDFVKAFSWVNDAVTGGSGTIRIVFWGYNTQPHKPPMVILGHIIDDFDNFTELGFLTIHPGDNLQFNAAAIQADGRFRDNHSSGDYVYVWIDADGLSGEPLSDEDYRRLPETEDYLKPRLRKAVLDADEYIKTVYAHDLSLARVATAVIHFMNQRITTIAKRGVPRANERRLPEAWRKRLINVIQLRAREYLPREDSEPGESRSYHTRWVVRGHWRHYWCGGRSKDCLQGGEHERVRELRYILPYVAGPEGLPVQGATKLFAVTR